MLSNTEEQVKAFNRHLDTSPMKIHVGEDGEFMYERGQDSFVIFYRNNDMECEYIQATPFWDDNGYITINLVGHENEDPEELMEFPFLLSGDNSKDFSRYLDEMRIICERVL